MQSRRQVHNRSQRYQTKPPRTTPTWSTVNREVWTHIRMALTFLVCTENNTKLLETLLIRNRKYRLYIIIDVCWLVVQRFCVHTYPAVALAPCCIYGYIACTRPINPLYKVLAIFNICLLRRYAQRSYSEHAYLWSIR